MSEPNADARGAGDESIPDADVLVPSVVPDQRGEEVRQESVESPGKVMRIGSMIKQLLEEVRQTELDEASRERLREIYETSISEVAESLSPDLAEELGRLALPFDRDAAPSGPELRIAKAQLVGWLEGLFHGIQATLFAQQMAARQQLEQMRGQLGPGAVPHGMQPRPETETEGEERPMPGTYL